MGGMEWTGDADGLGEVRKKELVRSCRRLGIRVDSDVTTIEHRFSLPPFVRIPHPSLTEISSNLESSRIA